MKREELDAWLQLVLADGVGTDAVRRLLAAFGLPQQVLAQSAYALQQVVSQQQALAILQPTAQTHAQQQRTWEWLHTPQAGVAKRIVTLACANYPASLLNIADPPVLLYMMGQLQHLGSTPMLAVVGSRNPTQQGAEHARTWSSAFANAGYTVVSGLALGIDQQAHLGALQAPTAPALATIAVMGTGVDRVYPRHNLELAHRIAQHGLLVSEYPLGAPPLTHHFPRRNRIIAGLSQGVLVVEAAPQSGSLITARMGSEQGKEVYAIPGSVQSPHTRGCHSLIKQGAKLVENAQEVLDDLRPQLGKQCTALSQPMPSAPSTKEDPILQALGFDPLTLDTLLARTGMDAAYLQARLLELELDNQVTRLPGGLFHRCACG